MSLLDRLRFQWSCIVAAAKSRAGDREPAFEPPTFDEKLEEMQQESTAVVLTSLLEDLPTEGGADDE